MDDVPLSKVLEADVGGVKLAMATMTSHLVEKADSVDTRGDSLSRGPLTEEELNEPFDHQKQCFRALLKSRITIYRRYL